MILEIDAFLVNWALDKWMFYHVNYFVLTYCFLSRPTLYVGKYSTSLYASPSMVHEGVTVVVSWELQEMHNTC